MDLGTAIKTIRKQKGISQKDLAKSCNLSANSMVLIEKNEQTPSKTNLNNICQALNIPPAYLLFFSITDEDMPSTSRELFNALYIPLKNVLLKDISNK